MARGKGEGSITELPNGMYQARITTGYDKNGKQKRQAKYFKTKREAKDWLTEVKAAQNKGDYIEPSKMTVADWMDIWLVEYKKRSVRANTYNSLYHMTKIHIKPAIGSVKLKDLRSETVQKFINKSTDMGLARKSVIQIFSCLHGALEQAVTNELIIKNVADKAICPKEDKKEMRVLTVEEQARFIETAKNSYNGDMFILMLATGLRVGEALALTWDDIDFTEGVLSVSKQMVRHYEYEDEVVKSQKGIGPPKTKSGNRIVPLIPSVLEMLESKKANTPCNEKNLVFYSVKGDWLSHGTAAYYLKRMLKKADIDSSVHLHTLRHTFATPMYDKRKNPCKIKVFQRQKRSSMPKVCLLTFKALKTMKDTAEIGSECLFLLLIRFHYNIFLRADKLKICSGLVQILPLVAVYIV